MAHYTLRVMIGHPWPNPYTWEILKAGEVSPVKTAKEAFRTAILAKIDGHKALRQLQGPPF
jgi:hypothetical protein